MAILSLVTLIWGTTFVCTRELEAGDGGIPPAVLVLARFGLASVLFLPFFPRNRRLWGVGLELGFWLWCGYAAQAVGLRHTSAGRSAFITSLNVIFVPALTAAAGRRVSGVVWVAAGVALAGAALLSYDGSPPNAGDAWTLVTAATYAVYIVRLERYAGRYPAPALTFVQLVAVTLFCGAWAAAERPAAWGMSTAQLAAVVYLGVVCTAVTTWLQAVGQQTVPGPQASLLYTLEPVWASAFAWWFVGERFGPRGWTGAGMLLAAALVSQWPGGGKSIPVSPEAADLQSRG